MTGPSWGTDPLLRWLRAISVVAGLILLSSLFIDRSHPPELALVLSLGGMILLQLGYEVFIPGLSRGGKPKDDDDDR